ncbi:MAG: YgiQ family radical SAM protein [Candidatus Nanoarchaeia archaeon]|nr:YgiQ family radical SAM protein [Candidatus Nanoarchaeia archaeon]
MEINLKNKENDYNNIDYNNFKKNKNTNNIDINKKNDQKNYNKENYNEKDYNEKKYDVIFITAQYHDDHPLCATEILKRIVEDNGFSIKIIEKPKNDNDYLKFGKPNLAFFVTSGPIDSMLNNFTPLKKDRNEDKSQTKTDVPNRAIIKYCNDLKRLFKDSYIVIGGIESSLRRFAHYDYWENKIRKSILLDSKANILVYGNGEIQSVEILKRLKNKENMIGIEGTSILSKDLPNNTILLPSFKEVFENKEKFIDMQKKLSVYFNLAQEYDNNYIIQFKYPKYTSEYLDYIYSLDYTRKLHPKSQLKMAQFSIVTHRGCIGNCNFCSIAMHQGSKIISRSEENILKEIEKITKMKEFKGIIDDLGGPSANMYKMDCKINCFNNCITCNKLNRSHREIIELLRKARNIKGIKKIFVRSGIRYDLAIESEEYIEEISKHHISGVLKIAPEHFSNDVLKLMNKESFSFDKFKNKFDNINKNKNQELKYYIMIGHPGENKKTINELIEKSKKLKNIESFQFFTPTPMSNSTCMYYTGKDLDKNDIDVIYSFKEKKEFKRKFLKTIEEVQNQNKKSNNSNNNNKENNNYY